MKEADGCAAAAGAVCIRFARLTRLCRLLGKPGANCALGELLWPLLLLAVAERMLPKSRFITGRCMGFCPGSEDVLAGLDFQGLTAAGRDRICDVEREIGCSVNDVRLLWPGLSLTLDSR